MNRGKKFTDDEIAYIYIHYPNTLTKDIAKVLNRLESSITGRAIKNGIRKSPEHLQKVKSGELGNSRKTMFGNKVAWNKGLKGLTNKSSTKFKKGNIPHNAKEADGAISIRIDKNGNHYHFIRVALGKWYHYGRYVWESVNGKIEKGMCLRHIDGNTLNDDISNLEVITRRENMIRNSITRYNTEERQVLTLIKKINKKVQSHEKHKQ